MHEVMSRVQWAAFLEWAVSKKLISKKEASKLETLVNQAQKEMKNLFDDKKMDKSKHENFRQSFEEVHKHLLTYQDIFYIRTILRATSMMITNTEMTN